ncbi:hypothetical protein ACFX4I_24645 [Peribacillus sp. YIM B13472]|uniref:hypothetical protein n=1 Tax=Peribacillus sp. YIM B13472 TaxID=3366297 RepID=UPI0036714021
MALFYVNGGGKLTPTKGFDESLMLLRNKDRTGNDHGVKERQNSNLLIAAVNISKWKNISIVIICIIW